MPATTTQDLTDLINAAESRRAGRVEQVRVVGVAQDGKTYHAVVEGSRGAMYAVRITTGTKRGFRCSCRDCSDRGRQVGPCKHTLAVAHHLLDAK